MSKTSAAFFGMSGQNAIETVLDSLDALVYVADMDTHELLFLNRYGREHWGVPNGRKCWQVLQQGQTGPCSFCTNKQLRYDNGEPGGVHVWEFRNTVTGHWYQCRDQAILWPDGRTVRLEIATDISELKEVQAQLKVAKQHAQAQAHQDELTGLSNRRAFMQAGQMAIDQAARLGHPVALIAFDADHFKQINDQHGHLAGDRVLQRLAATIGAVVRSGDVLARIGGEEFALLLPGANIQAASELAERLRVLVEAMDSNYDGHQISVTCSFGVTASTDGSNSLQQLMLHADKATYNAKRRQRNCIDILPLPTC